MITRLVDIRRIVADQFGLPVSALMGKDKTHGTALARHVAIYFCAELTPQSRKEIGRFWNRDVAAVNYAVKRITRLSEDQRFAEVLERIKLKFPEAEDYSWLRKVA